MSNDLPDACLSLLPSDGTLIYIQRGQSGYDTSNWDTGNPDENRKIADYYNKQRGITRAQESAMLHGSMFGFDTPAADPSYYMNQQPPEINAGYAIIKRETVGKIEFVLGESISEPGMYVTWRRTPGHEHDGRPQYYWGNYFNSRVRAEENLQARVKEETERIRENSAVQIQEKPPKRQGLER